MRKWYRRIPKGWKLALALTLAALLLTGFWLLQGRPCFSAASAFRQGLRNAAIPAVRMELGLDPEPGDNSWNWDKFGVGTDGERTFGVELSKRSSERFSFLHIWKPFQGVRTQPVTEGICYLPVTTGWTYLDRAETKWTPDPAGYEEYDRYSDDFPRLRDFILIKAPGDWAKLTLVLEDAEIDDKNGLRKGGVYGLEGERLEGDWYRFTFRDCYLPVNVGGSLNWSDFERQRALLPDWEPDIEASWAYYNWVAAYTQNELEASGVQPAHFELTIYDETGTAVRTVTLEP